MLTRTGAQHPDLKENHLWQCALGESDLFYPHQINIKRLNVFVSVNTESGAGQKTVQVAAFRMLLQRQGLPIFFGADREA
jgi:hypothetical protein